MAQSIDDSSTVYLDYNATTPLDPFVLESIHDALQHAWGNPSSSHHLGRKANEIISEARASVAFMVNAPPSAIVFTSGGTESNNMVIQTAVKYYERYLNTLPADKVMAAVPHFITSNQEHDSVILPMEHLKNANKIELDVVNVAKDSGMVTAEAVKEAIKPNTCLVSVMLANNETGVIQPVDEITEMFRSLEKERNKAGLPEILIHTDAAQALGKINVDVVDLDTDYLTVVGHKFYGPRIGALYVSDVGESGGAPLEAMLFGGGQERNYRPGTENTGMIAGLGKAAELVADNWEHYEEHMRKVRNYLESKLTQVFGSDNIHINGKFPSSERLPNTCNVSFLGEGLHGRAILDTVDHLVASVGAACHSDRVAKPSHILLALGIPSEVAMNAIRMSVGRETSLEDIDLVVEDLKTAVETLKEEQSSLNSAKKKLKMDV